MKYLSILLALAVLISAAGCAGQSKNLKYGEPLIKAGMTPEQVKELLGEPMNKKTFDVVSKRFEDTTYKVEIWDYEKEKNPFFETFKRVVFVDGETMEFVDRDTALFKELALDPSAPEEIIEEYEKEL